MRRMASTAMEIASLKLTGSTFEAVSTIKATSVASCTHCRTASVVDDVLVVEVLKVAVGYLEATTVDATIVVEVEERG